MDARNQRPSARTQRHSENPQSHSRPLREQQRILSSRSTASPTPQSLHAQRRPQRQSPLSPLAIFLIGIVLLLIAAIAFVSVLRSGASSQAIAQGEATSPEQATTGLATQESGTFAPTSHQVKVTFAGDCTLGTDEAFDYSRSLNKMFEEVDDPSYFLKNVKPIFEDDDLTIVNMEGTLTDSKDRQDKKFAFKGPAEFAKIFSSSSVEAASMANNHSKDYGPESYEDTLAALDSEGIQTFGYDRIAYFDINEVKVALVGTYELAEGEGIQQEMCDRIQEARDQGAQLVMVYIHWGDEREYVPNGTQVKLGHAAIDAGADLVVGSHPHVIQGWEVYNGRYIVYSLGNFCFGGNSNPADKDCMIFQQTFTVQEGQVEKNDDVEFIACSISSVSSRNDYQPTPATGDEKERIDAKIQESTDAIAAL